MQSTLDGERRIEIVIGNLLRWGTAVSATVIALGGAGYLMEHGRQTPQYRTFVGEPTELRSVHGVLADAAALDWRGIIQLGLLLLVATPIARVAFSLVAFARLRDWLYVVVSAIVLTSLLYSLLAS